MTIWVKLQQVRWLMGSGERWVAGVSTQILQLRRWDRRLPTPTKLVKKSAVLARDFTLETSNCTRSLIHRYCPADHIDSIIDYIHLRFSLVPYSDDAHLIKRCTLLRIHRNSDLTSIFRLISHLVARATEHIWETISGHTKRKIKMDKQKTRGITASNGSCA